MARTAACEVVPRIEAPVVDKLVIRVIVDGAHDIFIPEQKVRDIAVAQARLQGGGKYRRTLQSEWGLALHLTTEKATESRRYLLDFAYTPDVLNNNIELLDIELAAVDGMILSHGHLDHWGACRDSWRSTALQCGRTCRSISAARMPSVAE
jgi:7,8-dihydropterin-6-yl-methyl-4-(beta-D-ribofuranosyl)aminobenzene 5'-phosphate synthase